MLEIIREDAEEWLELLEAIESNIVGDGSRKLTPREVKEVKQIGGLTKQIKGLIRKGD